MPSEKIDQTSLWKNLEQHATVMQHPGTHLKNLLNQKDRLKNFSLNGAEIFFDFSRQRVDEAAMDLLFELSSARNIKREFHSMINTRHFIIKEFSHVHSGKTKACGKLLIV